MCDEACDGYSGRMWESAALGSLRMRRALIEMNGLSTVDSGCCGDGSESGEPVSRVTAPGAFGRVAIDAPPH